MSVLVTGAGMVASQVAAKLVEKGEDTVIYDLSPRLDYLSTVLDLTRVEVVVGDVLDMARLVETVRSKGIRRIIHTAGWLTEAALMAARPYHMFRVNLMGTANVLEAARIMGVERVITSSSGAVYINAPRPESRAYSEEFAMKALSPVTAVPGGLYALTKMVGEHLGQIYGASYGVEFAAVRYSAVFGPLRGKAAGTAGRMIDRLVRGGVFHKPVKIEAAIASGGEIIYSKDAAAANVLACFAPELPSRAYNISMAQPYSVEQIIAAAREVFPGIEIDTAEIPATSPAFPAAGYSFDISAAQGELGFRPLNLKDAMKDFAEWVRRYESPEI